MAHLGRGLMSWRKRILELQIMDQVGGRERLEDRTDWSLDGLKNALKFSSWS